MMDSALWRKLGPTLVATTVALTTIAYAPPRAYAQSGECCVQTAPTQESCAAPGCSESVKYVYCQEPKGTNSTLWKIAQIHCCNEVFTTYTANTGETKGCSDASIIASVPPTALDNAVYVEGVWVRTCGGRYVFTVRPVAG